MDVFEVLADPVRRRLIELIGDEEQAAGELVNAIRSEFGISQPAVSNALRVLREGGLVDVEPRGTSRIYRLRQGGLTPVDDWLDRHGRFWQQRLDALDTELARGRRKGANDVVREVHPGADRNAG